MMFCPKCKGILIPKKEGQKTILFCKNCEYKDEKSEIRPKEAAKEKKEIVGIEIADSEKETRAYVDAICPKCGNDKAYFRTMQTRGWDEPETQFYKCTKCSHSWRENA